MPRAIDAAYRSLLRPLLFRFDPERTHRWALRLLERIAPGGLIEHSPELRANLLGIDFSNPIGLAGGMDKDGRAIGAWQRLGFGFAEIGTITPRPQPGNPPSRIWRLPKNRALINRLGFPSEGMEAVARRLQAVRRRELSLKIAINIGPNKETPPGRVVEDYCALAGRLGPLADLLVINVSSPNTPGLRQFQAPDQIKSIIGAVRVALPSDRAVSILIKVAPDLSQGELDQIADTALELQIGGIVATNTTIQREILGIHSVLAGGLSGAPLRQLARRTIARLFERLHGRLPIIGVGGIASAEDAYAHFRAGANLVELYTGLIYEGPFIVHEIKRGLIRLLARDGFRSISDAVGGRLL